MCLAVFVGLGPPFLGIVASLNRFLVVVMRLLSSLVNEEAGHLQIAFFICGVVKFDQRQLDLLVAGVARDLAFFRTESLADQIGVAAHGIQEIAAPGGVEMRHRGFDKMPCAVELMAVPQVFPAHFRLDVDEVVVHVAVRLLHGDDVGDNVFQRLFQFLVIFDSQGIAAGLDPLGNIGIPEVMAFAFVAGLETVKTSRLPALLFVGRDSFQTVGLHFRSPEFVRHFNFGERNSCLLCRNTHCVYP